MMALPAPVPPARAQARAALNDPVQSARANQFESRRRSSRMAAITAGLRGLMPRPGSFLAWMSASLIWLALSHHLIAGVAVSSFACLSVASDRLSERRSRAAREPSE